jgi:hypothetical protein
MRPAFTRTGRLAPLAFACFVVALILAPSIARAQEVERFNLSAFGAYGAERFHSLGADTVGLSSNNSPDGGLLIDFRVIDLPMGKTGPKPSLHLTGGITTTTRILGPPLKGMEVDVFKVLDLSGGALLDLPLDALLKGNSGVSLRLGWDGGDMLTRTSDTNFLIRSKFRMDFVRTGGPLAGSLIGFGKGVDQTFGYDAASNRADVHASLQGTVIRGASFVPPSPPVKPGAKPLPPKPAIPGARLMWIFLDVIVDTDGGPGADGMRARAGVGFDVSAFTTAAFATRH